MRAIRIHEYGDASRLIYEEAPLPEPRAGEVRVKVEAAGLNFIEVYQRTGTYQGMLPFTPGAEFCGVVDALGEGVAELKPGDRVTTAQGKGAYAEYAIVEAEKAVKVPDGLSSEEVAAVTLQGITAHYLALSTYPLKKGDTALVHAAAGGVGQLLVQIAKLRGARVLATASSEKTKIAKEAGADEVIKYAEAPLNVRYSLDFESEVKRLTDGRGVEVVYDGVGKTTFHKSLNCLKRRGMMVLFGQASGKVDPIDPQLLNQKGSLFLTRPSVAAYLQDRAELLWRVNDLFEWMLAGKLKVRIDLKFALKDAAEAHHYLEAGSTKGKVLLVGAQ
ncbi:MAG: quinone oxidoreductase [Anaerolineales bacterium]